MSTITVTNDADEVIAVTESTSSDATKALNNWISATKPAPGFYAAKVTLGTIVFGEATTVVETPETIAARKAELQAGWAERDAQREAERQARLARRAADPEWAAEQDEALRKIMSEERSDDRILEGAPGTSLAGSRFLGEKRTTRTCSVCGEDSHRTNARSCWECGAAL